MAYTDLFNYKVPTTMQNSVIDKLGVDVTLFTPTENRIVGYEDITNKDSFIKRQIKCFINFNVKRRVFYHFNWFPEKSDELVQAFVKLSESIQVESFIRTKTIENVSVYGDVIFKIVKIADDGKYKTLRRTLFMTPVNDRQLYHLLKVENGEGNI